MVVIDSVTVSYNSADHLRRCVESLLESRSVRVTVVDNASSDGSLDAIRDLDVTTVPLDWNGGFAHGCNVGWRLGSAQYVLFVNPDAVIKPSTLDRLVGVLENDPAAGAIAPKIVDEEGRSAYSARWFPHPVRTFSQAFFLHRLFPNAKWADELIRDERLHRERWSPDWVSGACLLVRRRVLEELGGWDERFFLFGEDVDLCRRLKDAGYTLWLDPTVTCIHVGGASAARSTTLPLLMAGRLKFIELHYGPLRQVTERFGAALNCAIRFVVGPRSMRGARMEALRIALGLGRPYAPSHPARSLSPPSGPTAVAAERRSR